VQRVTSGCDACFKEGSRKTSNKEIERPQQHRRSKLTEVTLWLAQSTEGLGRRRKRTSGKGKEAGKRKKPTRRRRIKAKEASRGSRHREESGPVVKGIGLKRNEIKSLRKAEERSRRDEAGESSRLGTATQGTGHGRRTFDCHHVNRVALSLEEKKKKKGQKYQTSEKPSSECVRQTYAAQKLAAKGYAVGKRFLRGRSSLSGGEKGAKS